MTGVTCISILLWAPEQARATSDEHGWATVFSPKGHLYRPYIADPLRPTVSVTGMNALRSDISNAGSTRIGLRIGGNWGFWRFYRAGKPNRGFQIDAEAGFQSQFDVNNSLDVIGWNGRFAFLLSWLGDSDVALRTGIRHDSSHIGDEYVIRTGRERIEYKRDAVVLGASWDFARSWRIYGEGGYAFNVDDDSQREARLEAGLELTPPPRWWGGRLGWYAASDLSSYEEDDWDPNLTLQAGMAIKVNELARLYRIGVQYYTGRSQLGEFFQNEERILSIGFWLDL